MNDSVIILSYCIIFNLECFMKMEICNSLVVVDDRIELDFACIINSIAVADCVTRLQAKMRSNVMKVFLRRNFRVAWFTHEMRVIQTLPESYGFHERAPIIIVRF